MPRPDPPKIDHPHVFSASQIETYVTCPRKWAFIKIDRIEAPQNEAAALGGRVHDILEDFVGKGIEIDFDTEEGQIIQPGLKLLPIPGTPGLSLEGWFSIQFGAAAYVGYKDIQIISPTGDRPQVKDYKTTGSFTWKKSPKELLEDIQAGIYAADAMVKTGWEEVDLEWIYFRTKGGRKAEPTAVRIYRPHVNKILTRIDGIAQEMIEIREKGLRALEVRPDYSGCSKFGGCPFRDKECPKISSTKKLTAMIAHKSEESARMKDAAKTNKFLADLKARNKARGGGTPEREKKKAREIDVKNVTEANKVNPPERDTARQPPPPDPKNVGGKWIQPVWDEAAWEWLFPEGTDKAEKAAAKAAEKSKTGKGMSKAAELLAKRKGATKAVEEIEEEPPAEEVEEEEELALTPEDRDELANLLDGFANLIADKIAARLNWNDE